MAAESVVETPRDFDAEMALLQKEADDARARQKAIREEFGAAVVEFYRGWYWQRVETAVFERPEVTRGLGRERLAQLKAAVRALQAALPDHAAECFPDRLWAIETWHPQESPQALERAALPLAEPLYQLLVDYGYERYHGRKVAGPRLNEALGRLLAEYAQLAVRLAQLERQVRGVAREKEQAVAKEAERREIEGLWNSA
jgi:hypothetical protein